jgi:uncharacterized protein (DUF697 family)
MPKKTSTSEDIPSATETVEDADTTATRTPVMDEAPGEVVQTLHEQAEQIVRKNTYWSAGLGAIPVPGLDLVGIMGGQVKLIHELSKLYGVTFCENKARNTIAVLLSSVGAVNLTLLPVSSMLKLIPGIGTILGGLSLPIIGGGAAYALGKVFINHFEAGGTLLDFDPEKTKDFFRKQFEEGKLVATSK